MGQKKAAGEGHKPLVRCAIVISASGVATVLRDAGRDRRTRGARSAARARRRRQRQPIRAETTEAADTQLQCIIPSGARANGVASCARRTGRATPTSSGRADPPPMPQLSDRDRGSAHPARPCPRRSDCTGTRSATLGDLAGTAPPHLRDVIRTRDERPRTTGGDAALSRQPASKRPSSAIGPSPPRPLDGRSGKR